MTETPDAKKASEMTVPMVKLIYKLEKMGFGDLHVDAEIARVLGFDVRSHARWGFAWRPNARSHFEGLPRWTSSTDDAVKLLPKGYVLQLAIDVSSEVTLITKSGKAACPIRVFTGPWMPTLICAAVLHARMKPAPVS